MKCNIPFCKGPQTRDNMARFEIDCSQYLGCSTTDLEAPFLENTEKGISTFWIYAVSYYELEDSILKGTSNPGQHGEI